MAGGKKNAPIVVAQIMGKMNGGGVEAVIMNYYRHIDRSKVQFDFICDEDSTNIPYEEIEKLGGHVILCPPYQKLHKYMKFLENLFREKKYRIVHSNINTLSVFPLKAAKKAGVKVRIAHSHNTSNPKEFKRNIIKNILRKFSKKYATDYFACSEAAGRYQFGDKAYDEGKVIVVRNAIDIDMFKYDPSARRRLRKEIGIKEDDFVIGHIGAFRRQKNHAFLIDVFAEVKKKKRNAKLVLVGQGPLKDGIKEKVKKLGLEKDVFFLGQRDDTNKLYSIFDIFCLPSLYEGFPVVGIEAQANGLCCIFSNTITKEIQVSGNNHLLTIKNIDGFAKQIVNCGGRSNNKSKLYDIDKESSELQNNYIQNSKIRVIHLLSTDVFSGAENVGCQIINGFKNDPKYSEMIYVSRIGTNRQFLEARGIKYYSLYGFNKKSISRALAELKPDIVHAHDVKASVMAARCIRGGISIISHVHNNHEDMRKTNIKTLAYNHYKNKYNCIIWVSKSAFDSYRFNKRIEGRSLVLYNVIDSDYLIKTSKEATNRTSYDVVFLGRMTYQKNPERFIGILDKIRHDYPDIKAAMIGDGELIDDVRELIKARGLNRNIDVLGRLDNPYGVLSGSKMLVMTSRYEGTPMVALEAIALGKPIISTPADGIVDIVKNGYNGYLSDEDSVLAAKIKEVIKDKLAAEKYTKNSNAINGVINNSEKYISTISGLYSEVI